MNCKNEALLTTQELVAISQELIAKNQEIKSISQELIATNQEIKSISQELIATNQEINVKCRELETRSRKLRAKSLELIGKCVPDKKTYYRIPIALKPIVEEMTVKYRRPHLQYLQELRVLLVYSSDDFSHMMTVLLQFYGVEVLTASLSQQALEMFVLWKPDIILSDIAMLHKDSCILIQQLRTKVEKLGKMVIGIAVTNSNNKEMFRQDLCLGFNIKFISPLDIDDFLTMLSTLVICQQSSYVIAQQTLGIKPLLVLNS